MWAPSKERGAFDFEAWKWVNPRCCGLLWGAPGERNWRFVVDEKSKWPLSVAPRVLRTMLAIAECGGPWEWWAHNGGKYDDCFLLEACIRMGWAVEGHVAAGRLITMTITPPDSKRSLKLYDSMAMLPSKLKDVAKDFQLKSSKLLGEDDYSVDVRRWSLERLELGCRADCEVVLEALERVESMLEEWGGGLRATFSAAALSVVEAKTPDLPSMLAHRVQNSVARSAYCGGRVEVFHHRPEGWLTEWDVNSSYPWSMTQKLPYRLKGSTFDKRHIEATLKGERFSGVVLARVKVPDTEIPPLPFIHPEGGVYFPTGEWEAWFSAPELAYARELGVHVEPLEAIRFTAEEPFGAFVGELYSLKRTATGALKSFAKFMLNGCYGKFGQRPERENLRIFASEEEAFAWALSRPDGTTRPLSAHDERFWSEAVEKWAKRTHYALAAAVTAHSRILLHRALVKAKGLAYCDTDSVHASGGDFETGPELGQLKVEIKRMRAKFYAPKLYELHPEEGEPHYACKGFPVTEKDFRAVVKSWKRDEEPPVKQERMRLVRTQLRHGGGLSWDTIEKRWGGFSKKRCPSKDGSTRPWTVRELLDGVHLQAASPVR